MAARPAPPIRSAFGFLLDGARFVGHEAGSDEGNGESTPPNEADRRFLAAALVEAQKAVGWTTPNPPVGAVVVDAAGDVVGRGHTAPVGGPHAEVCALRDAGPRATGACVYVTLEPCAHVGRTPPCTDALIAAGVARVVVATLDPNPRVNGKGIDALRHAGIVVDVVAEGDLQAQAADLILPFAKTLERNRPWTIAKVATTLDGSVAMATKDSRWVTGPLARSWVHALRSRVDAILVGSGTVAADDPALTARDLPRGEIPRRQPRRLVIDGRLQTSTSAAIFQRHPLDLRPPLVAHATRAPDARRTAFDEVDVERFEAGDTRVDLPALWTHLAACGLNSLLVEPGPRLFSALLLAGLIDEIWWFTAPKIAGGDAVSAVGPLGFQKMADALGVEPSTTLQCDQDLLTVGRLVTPGARKA